MKRVKCKKTKHERFMSKECIECVDINQCDREALGNKDPFNDVRVDHI